MYYDMLMEKCFNRYRRAQRAPFFEWSDELIRQHDADSLLLKTVYDENRKAGFEKAENIAHQNLFRHILQDVFRGYRVKKSLPKRFIIKGQVIGEPETNSRWACIDPVDRCEPCYSDSDLEETNVFWNGSRWQNIDY